MSATATDGTSGLHVEHRNNPRLQDTLLNGPLFILAFYPRWQVEVGQMGALSPTLAHRVQSDVETFGLGPAGVLGWIFLVDRAFSRQVPKQ